MKISCRHLDMAEILEKKEYYEGSIFHAYHALEAICCAELEELSDDYDHVRRLKSFIAQDTPEELRLKFLATSQYLGSLTQSKNPVGTRNKTLFYDRKQEPHKRFQAKDARIAIERVDEVVRLTVNSFRPPTNVIAGIKSDF